MRKEKCSLIRCAISIITMITRPKLSSKIVKILAGMSKEVSGKPGKSKEINNAKSL